MTLCGLRQNLSEEDIFYRFKMPVGNVSTILSTWITFLARELEGLICWPTGEEVIKFYPDFARVIILQNTWQVYQIFNKIITVFLYKKCTLPHFSNTDILPYVLQVKMS